MQSEKIVFLQDGKLLFFDGEKFYSALPRDVYKSFVGATISSKLLQTYQFKTSSDITEDQLAIQAEIQIYENGGLDPNVEYVIDYLSFKVVNSNSLYVEVFAVPTSVLKEQFKKYEKITKIVDFIAPKFLVYKSLYSRNILDNSTDIIFHFSEEDSFVAVYNNGEYIIHKQIDSLDEIASKCNIHTNKLKRFLAEKGFDEGRYEDIEEEAIYNQILEIFTSNLQKIIHIVNNKRSIFGFEKVERVLVDFEGKTIPDFDRFYSFLSFEEIEYSAIEVDGVDAKNIHSYICAAYFFDLANELYEDRLNFTIFERKPPIYKRELFKYLSIISLTIFLNSLCNSYLIQQTEATKARIDAINQRLKKHKTSVKSLQKMLEEEKKKKAEMKELINKKAQEVKYYKDTLIALRELSNSNITREKFINDILEVLEAYNLSVSRIVQNGDREVEISLIAEYNQRDRIAQFIETLAKMGYKDVSTGDISLNNDVYESTVRIVR